MVNDIDASNYIISEDIRYKEVRNSDIHKRKKMEYELSIIFFFLNCRMWRNYPFFHPIGCGSVRIRGSSFPFKIIHYEFMFTIIDHYVPTSLLVRPNHRILV